MLVQFGRTCGEGVKRAPFIIVPARSEGGRVHSHVDPPRVRRWVGEGSFNLVFNQATILPRNQKEGLLNHPPIRADAASLPLRTLEREGAVVEEKRRAMLFLGRFAPSIIILPFFRFPRISPRRAGRTSCLFNFFLPLLSMLSLERKNASSFSQDKR